LALVDESKPIYLLFTHLLLIAETFAVPLDAGLV